MQQTYSENASRSIITPVQPPKKMTEMHSYHFYYILTKKVIRNQPTVSWLTSGADPSDEEQSKDGNSSKTADAPGAGDASQGDSVEEK